MSDVKADAKAIFLEALDCKGADELMRFLDQACGADTALRTRVEELLRAHRDAGAFLGGAGKQEATRDEAIAEGPGTVIGPYKLMEQIGEGGMGLVFVAEQQHPVRRKVAVKVIKPGMDTREVIARFEAERQALALMDHPNIARVFDAGATDSGRPYFVMELVRGVGITEFCDQNRLTPRERLELFVHVCQAVQHAHQKGIIHRDLKATNILVTLHDGTPVVKVIDFGVAKAIGQQLTDKTIYTRFAQMIGTPMYMSPEQAEMSGLDIDTRSDIYALGVLLYELLTGATPFDKERLRTATYDEIRRIVREEEPPRPSQRISTFLADALTAVSAQRQTDPKRLSQLCRGELDWIVMKALEKDRNRRYETASAFAADVQRYLNDEPVQACPPSAMYRFRKFARRNKRMLATAGVIMLALVLGTAVSVWQAIRATDAEGLAEERLETAEEQRQRAQASEREAKTKEGLAKDAQKQSVESLKDALAAVDQMLTRVAEDRLVYVPQMEPIRRDLLLDALKFYQKFLEKQSDEAAIRQEAALAYRRVGSIHRQLGQYTDADKAYRKAIAIMEELYASASLEPAFRYHLVNTHIEFSWLSNFPVPDRSKADEALLRVRPAVQVAEKLMEDFPKVPDYRAALVNARNVLASQLTGRQPDEAEKILRRNLQMVDDAFNLEGIYRGLVCVFQQTRHLAEAEEASRQALKYAEQMAVEAPAANWVQYALANDLRILAGLLAANQRPAEAEEYQRRGILIREKLATDFPAGPDYRHSLANAQVDHAGVLKQLGRTAEAEKAYRRAVHLYEKLAADFPTIPWYRQTAFDQRLNLGQFLKEGGRLQDALQVYGDVGPFLAKLPADFPSRLKHWEGLVRTHVELGRLLAKSGKTEEAEAAYRRAAEIQEKLEKEFAGKAENRRELAQSHWHAADLFRDVGRLQEAETVYGLWRAHSGPELERLKKAAEADPNNGLRWWFLAIASYRSGNWQDSLDIFKTKEHLGHGVAGSAWQWFYMAMAHWQLDHKEEAHSWYYQSIDWVERAQEKRLVAVQAEAAALMDLPDPGERPEQAWRYSQTGTDLEKQGQKDKAMEAYGKAIDFYEKLRVDFPTVPVYRTKLVDLLNKTGRGKDVETVDREAISRLEKLAAAHPKMILYRQVMGDIYRQLGEWDKAAAEYTKAIELKQDAWEVWSGRAFVHFSRQQWDKAIVDYSKAIDVAPHVHTNWWHRGHAYLQVAQWDKAAADFGKVVEGWPDEPEAWYVRAVAFAQLKQPDKALADLRQAIAKGLNNVEKLKNEPKLAPLRSHDDFKKLLDELEQKEKKKRDEAIADFRKAIDLDPKSAMAHNRLGAALRAQGRLDEAIACCRKAIELDPKYVIAHANLGFTLERQGKLDDAIACYRKSIELNPKYAWGHNALGRVLTRKGWDLANHPDPKLRDPKRAIEASKEAVEVAPQSVLAWQYLGWVHYRAGNWKASIEALETSCKLQNPGDYGQWIVMSLAHGKLANEKELPEQEQARHQADARRWYDQSVKQIGSRWSARPSSAFDQAIWDFRAEAAELLGLKEKKD